MRSHVFASYDKMALKHFAELNKSVRKAAHALRVIFLCAARRLVIDYEANQ